MLQRLLLVAVLLIGLSGVTQAQMLMPGPGGTLISSSAALATSSAVSVAGYGIVTFQTTTTGIASGTVTYQGSMDGTLFSPINCKTTGGQTIASTTVASGAVVSQFISCNTDGIPLVRAVLAPFTSGTWTVTYGASAMPRVQ